MRAIEISSVSALGEVQRRTTPGAVGLVIVTSGKRALNSFSSTTASAADVMQCAHGYSGWSGVETSGSQSATRIRATPGPCMSPFLIAVIGRHRLYVYLASNTAM